MPVPDPFRTLEDAAAPGTVRWVEAENLLTRQTLDGALRDGLVDRLRQLHRYPRSSAPEVRGQRLFFTHNDGSANQSALCVIDDTSAVGRVAVGKRRTLVDPNRLNADGTTAITAFVPDAEGRRVVYALSQDGSDEQTLHVVDVETGATLAGEIHWVKFASIAWHGEGFFYTRFPPDRQQYCCQVWFHRLGQSQAVDRLVYDRPDAPTIVFDVDVTSDDGHLVITSRPGASDKAEVHVLSLSGDPVPDHASRGALRPLVTGFTDGWHFVGGSNGRLFFRTDADAPKGRIVRLDLHDRLPAPHVVVAESGDTVVDAAIAGGRLIVHTLHNASSRLEQRDLDGGNCRDITLPGIGTVVGIGAEGKNERAYVTFTSFTTPPRILQLATTEFTDCSSVSPVSSVVEGSTYVTDQVWYSSKDGTPISMFLVRKMDRAPAPGPVLLTGYGGFNISLTPSFDPSDALWLDAGGTIAVAHLRGGGEYGDLWHQAGMRERKQHVFDDFIAAAEWLYASGVAAPGQIAIEGGSNGGLLVGAVMVQRPELFGAVICRVPVADMLRYHRFTVGRFWIPEYGCADNPDEFAWLLRYSPYHNVRDGVRYPPTLVMTADTDDRVDPGMAKKFAARLQEAGGGGPILLRVEARAGHGAGKPVAKQIDEQADMYAFLFRYVSAATPA